MRKLFLLAAILASACATTGHDRASHQEGWHIVYEDGAETSVAPGETVVQAGFGGVSRSFIGSGSCGTAGLSVDLNGAQQMFLHNFTADIIYIYPAGQNGSKTIGVPLCNVSTSCVPWFEVPSGSGVWECAGASGAVTLNIVGIAQ